MSLEGELLCGAMGREDDRTGKTVSVWSGLDILVGDEDGGTVMEIKVSTKRELITFSRPLCELSGSIAEKRAAGFD